MKLYRTTFGTTADNLTHASWAGTQSDAGKDRKAAKSAGGLEIKTEDVDVPTNKAGLLDFLNENCATVPDKE